MLIRGNSAKSKSPHKHEVYAATISSQWKAGAKWLFFMPWYDYGRTNDPASAAFNDQSHSSASTTWWKDAFNCDFVLSREDVKY